MGYWEGGVYAVLPCEGRETDFDKYSAQIKAYQIRYPMGLK